MCVCIYVKLYITSFDVLLCCVCSLYQEMYLKGRIAGMGIDAGRNTTAKNMLENAIMFAVPPGVLFCEHLLYFWNA